jgi:hypothetical protein
MNVNLHRSKFVVVVVLYMKRISLYFLFVCASCFLLTLQLALGLLSKHITE